MSTARFTPVTDQRPSTASSFSKKYQLSTNRRARQLLNYNQSFINNLINENTLSIKSIDSKVSTPRKVQSNESVLVKKPFKHYNLNSTPTNLNNKPPSTAGSSTTSKSSLRQQSQNAETHPPVSTDSKTIKPSLNLIVKTAQNVNNFVEIFEKNQGQASFVNTKNIPAKRPLQYSRYSGLKPLNYVVNSDGPSITNCIGIIKEPKSQSIGQLKELYEYKLKLLEKKRESERQSADSMNYNQEHLIYDRNGLFQPGTTSLNNIA